MCLPSRNWKPRTCSLPQSATRATRGVAALVAATLRVRDLERELEVAKAEVTRLEQMELPQAFTEASISELQIERGIGARRDLSVVGSLPSEEPRHTAGLNRLVEYGHQDNIRSMVTLNFGREHRDAALEYFNTVRTDNRAFVTINETIHHSTLRALALERVRNGQPVDFENLGLTVIRRVRLLRPPTRHVTLEQQEAEDA